MSTSRINTARGSSRADTDLCSRGFVGTYFLKPTLRSIFESFNGAGLASATLSGGSPKGTMSKLWGGMCDKDSDQRRPV